MAGVAILGCAATLAFGGLQRADRTAPQVQPVAVPGNVALAQTQVGNGYLEFSASDVSSIASTAIDVPKTAWTQTQAGAGFLEFQPGDGPTTSTQASVTPARIGFREYLDGEMPLATLPLASPATRPAPMFGPQP
jgi:hypothetical protein